MKRSLMLSILCSLAFACLTCPASATEVTVKLTGVNGATRAGVYVDPYFGTINGTPATLVCDDFSHETDINETWQANVSTFADLSGVRFQQGTPGATLLAYDQAAYLYEQLGANPSDIANISFALWALFTSDAKLSSGYTTGAANWLSKAQSQTFYAGEFSNFEILTPVNSGAQSPQEFLTTTPEPGTIMLLGTGLLMLGLGLKKKVMA